MGSRWMYKIRDYVMGYIINQTEAWLDEDKERLYDLLVAELELILKLGRK